MAQGREALPQAWSALVCRVGTRIRFGSDQDGTESRACEPVPTFCCSPCLCSAGHARLFRTFYRSAVEEGVAAVRLTVEVLKADGGGHVADAVQFQSG